MLMIVSAQASPGQSKKLKNSVRIKLKHLKTTKKVRRDEKSANVEGSNESAAQANNGQQSGQQVDAQAVAAEAEQVTTTTPAADLAAAKAEAALSEANLFKFFQSSQNQRLIMNIATKKKDRLNQTLLLKLTMYNNQVSNQANKLIPKLSLLQLNK